MGEACLHPYGVQRGLAADPARRGGVEVALDTDLGRRYAGGQPEIEHVVGVPAVVIARIAVPGVADVVD
jgi:hypothetical protein